jgi:hypothetical protein
MAEPPFVFAEKSSDEWSLEKARILQRKIAELGLRIEGTYLQAIVERLYAELKAAGIELRPKVYLSDEWSCPDGVPVIGIPFYLADKKLSRLEDEMMDGIEAETEEEILRYLRHEAGHAFNYAHKLYQNEEWLRVFGDYGKPYRDDYVPQPFSRNYVRHIPGWYAQKHPDEDFSETFAVWLDPHSNWREVYRDWGCYAKLLFVDRIVAEYGRRPPVVTGEDYDFASEPIVHASIEEHYEKMRPALLELPAEFDHDLREIFRGDAPTEGVERQRADIFIARHRRHLVERISHWTGLYDVIVRSLVNHFIERCRQLELWLDPKESEQTLVDLTACASALAMNRLYKGEFVLR